MFDNLRDEAASSSIYEEDEAKFQAAGAEKSVSSARRSSRFLGMTSIQRFVLAVLLLLAVCVIGALCLLVTGKVGF